MSLPEKKKQHVVRNVRIDTFLDICILKISEYEDRTISKVIQRLLKYAVNDYYKKNFKGDFGGFLYEYDSEFYEEINSLNNDNDIDLF